MSRLAKKKKVVIRQVPGNMWKNENAHTPQVRINRFTYLEKSAYKINTRIN